MEEPKACLHCKDGVYYLETARSYLTANAEKADFCPHCGRPLTDKGREILARRAAPENKPDLPEIDRVIRLYEDAANCPCDTYAQLILASLREYKAQHAENKPLTLEELRKMEGGWVWLIATEHSEYDGWYNVRPFHDGSGGIELYGVDNNYYERAIIARSVKVYARKPKGSEPNEKI